MGNSSWLIKHNTVAMEDTRSVTEQGSWNLLFRNNQQLKNLSKRELEKLGYKAKKEKK